MLTGNALGFVCCGSKIILLGFRNRRDARITDESHEAGERRCVSGVKLMFRGSEPGGRGG